MNWGNSLSTLLSAVLAVALFATATGSVVINEMDLAPSEVGSADWIELFNDGEEDLDIGGWQVRIVEGHWTGPATVPIGTVLFGGGYYVVTGDPRWVHDSNATAILMDSEGREVDRTPLLNDTRDDGKTWSRYPNGRDTDKNADWAYIPSTKSKENRLPNS